MRERIITLSAKECSGPISSEGGPAAIKVLGAKKVCVYYNLVWLIVFFFFFGSTILFYGKTPLGNFKPTFGVLGVSYQQKQ